MTWQTFCMFALSHLHDHVVSDISYIIRRKGKNFFPQNVFRGTFETKYLMELWLLTVMKGRQNFTAIKKK